MKQALIILLVFTAGQSLAQGEWSMQQCMQYAVEHNHEVKRAELELDNYKASKTGAIGRFLPSVDASIGAQYNFGRAIDPETNGYTDVSTFYNGYSLYASLPVFDGFSRIHALKAAGASTLMGRASLRQKQDQTALNVLQAYTNVAYYEGLVKMADEKVQETELLLKQIRLLEEVGRKQNLYASAMLELKKTMAFPMQDTLLLSVRNVRTLSPSGTNSESATYGLGLVQELNPELQAAQYQVQASKHEWHQARAAFYPSLSLSAGLNTTYYHTLHSDVGESFSNQFNNNMGEYVGATLSIPLFNRLQTITSIRKAKNNYRIAQETYKQKQLELEKLSREAWHSIAYQLTKRQFEEGLSTAIDLRTTSAQLLNSKATLLQCQLMAMVKEQLVRYYNGETIWTE